MKKNIIIILSLILSFILYFFILSYFEKQNNFYDHSGKFILNPEYKGFKMQLSNLKKVYPTSFSYQNDWFILPHAELIKKPINLSEQQKKMNIIQRRENYFETLCSKEAIKLQSSTSLREALFNGGLLDLSIYNGIQNFHGEVNNNPEILKSLNGNPFIYPIYNHGFIQLKENEFYNFNGTIAKPTDFLIDSDHDASGLQVLNNFVELMDSSGQLFRIEYKNTMGFDNKFIPAKKISNSNARYYKLERPIEREDLKNLGIYGYEKIIYDKVKKQLYSYEKNFLLGAVIPYENKNANQEQEVNSPFSILMNNNIYSDISSNGIFNNSNTNFSWADGKKCQRYIANMQSLGY